ncbi:hypothetical protein FHW67_003745 [Herbaspirillum sp. Sphag1AN]|uniref:metal-dependent hydrolase n=1 Tax=unclassified Herbaspirillum TaxID=2624150 RepID=UPI00162226AB|nr:MULTISPECIES: metal-dependent hydrolase [unclassified Herbaspirillum]MBB3214428.1 hypothetical protein [Herbaspirillum sp. Sphag1AN]MBB3247468.1 hypothetical protein [Herbaspirillum sp. Sphag64]
MRIFLLHRKLATMNRSTESLLIRKLDVDLAGGFPRHWHGGDAFLSMYFNALSMSFPVGEQFFIDAVRAGVALLPDTPEHAAVRQTVKDFAGQEATHRHLHHLYNLQLEQQGLVNRWQHWASRRVAITQKLKLHPRNLLALTAAYEHITAVFADGTLRYDNWLAGAEPAMQTLWRWHAAEETEHKAVAFDLYQTLGGGYLRRVAWFTHVLLLFTLESTRQTILNLHRDKSLFRARTGWSALKFLFGRNGHVWRSVLPLLGYYRPGFHPNDHDNHYLAQRWLENNSKHWRAIGPSK